MHGKPLVTHIYTADPSAHVFDGKIYIYTSHDLDQDIHTTREGDQFQMVDYHVFSMDKPDGRVVDHGCILHIDDVPWASKQMWAPDAAFKNGKYYFYFPARDKDNLFRIGVAVSDNPSEGFRAQPDFIKGSYSIDPCSFIDEDGQAYLYFGGLWGGQLEKWKDNQFDPDGSEPHGEEPAVCPRVARLDDSMLEFAEPPRDIVILDENGEAIKKGDEKHRYFEGPWMHKYEGRYYFSYSTGTTRFIAYAIGDSPYGPFTYAGRILTPVIGWTTHHSVVEKDGKWYVYYHDSSLSGGISHQRCIKMAELKYNPDGTIITVEQKMAEETCYLIWNQYSLKLARHRIYTVGRGSECNIRINDKCVSRVHCRIQWQGTTIFIEDTGSTNGLFLNDKKIENAALRNNDCIRIGTTEITVRTTRSDDEALTPSDTLIMEKKLEDLMSEINDPGLSGRLKEIKGMFERKKQKLSALAFKDGLTGLFNRRYFDTELEREVTRAKRYKSTVTLLFLDIDHFKELNDTYGHQKGDDILQVIGSVLMKNCRSIDIACRYGGEELAVILPEADKNRGITVAEKLRVRIRENTAKEGIETTVSIGIAEYNSVRNNPAALIRAADEALYLAKKNGRNQVQAAPE
ncbi:MAG: diguanylate cyclase [Spirochaetales bacterium]|nr:diguanylate cyclase [Spirochaetales bacterium]